MRLPSFQMFQQQLLKHSFKCSQERKYSVNPSSALCLMG